MELVLKEVELGGVGGEDGLEPWNGKEKKRRRMSWESERRLNK